MRALEMTSNRPYLIRAMSDWIIDNGMTPHILVNTESPDVKVPLQFVQEGKIVLNISPSAVDGLTLGPEYIFFSARFGGKTFYSQIPVTSVMAIYARENAKGMVFPEDESAVQPGEIAPDEIKKPKPVLRIVD